MFYDHTANRFTFEIQLEFIYKHDYTCTCIYFIMFGHKCVPLAVKEQDQSIKMCMYM